MNLQTLQTSLAAIIKSRTIALSEHEKYLTTIKNSTNVLLIKKIALWWRKIQTEPYCVLTCNYLKVIGKFDQELSNFMSEKDFSVFREEVGLQFLEYIVSKRLDSLTQSLAQFELAIIKLKLGQDVDCIVSWEYEPYSIISGLLHNTFNYDDLSGGNYEVLVNSFNKEELFTVRHVMSSTN